MTLPTSEELAARAPHKDATLTELQNWMVEVLRHQRGLSKSPEMRKASELHFSGNDRLSPADQINIYRQQFWLRHTRLLVDDFPGVSGLLGQAAWEPLVEGYLCHLGYSVRDLRNLGKQLPEYLGGLDGLKDKELLIEMAQLEWAYIEAFDAKNDSALSAEKLGKIPPDAWATAQIQLSHSLHLLRVDYPVAHLRRLLRNSYSEGRDADRQKKTHNLVVYRRDKNLWDKSISLPAFLLLEQFQKGVPLIAACETVIKENADAEQVFDEQLMEWFALWGRLGWITDVVIS